MINQQFTEPVLGLINSIKESIATLVKRFHFLVTIGLLVLLFSSSCKRKMPEPTQTGGKETFVIERFDDLKTKLKIRIDSNNQHCGPICRSLKEVDKNFTNKQYNAKERKAMLGLLDNALKSINSKSSHDQNIIEEIKLQFNGESGEEVIAKQPSVQQHQSSNNDSDEIKDLESSVKTYMFFAAFAAFLAALSMLVMQRFQKKLVEEKIKNREKDKEIEALKQQLLAKKDDQKAVPNTVSQNPLVVASNLNESTINVKTEYKQDYPSETVKPTNLTLFYLSTPQLDGSFNDNSKTAAYVPTSSMYKFNLISSDKAKFEFVNDPSSLKDALNYPDTYLLPVCRSLNARNINAYKIITTDSGVAELREGKWVVSHKAVIRYE